MQKMFAGLMSVGLLAMLAGPSLAWDGCCGGCGQCYEVVWVKKTVMVCQPQYTWQDVVRPVCRVVAVPVEKKCTVMVPQYTPVTKTIQCYRTEYHTEPREVCVCRTVPVCCTDPCTGCTYTCCQTVQEKCTINVCVGVCVPYTREVTCMVCNYVPVEKTYTCCTYQTVTDNVTCKVCVCNYVQVPCEVCVPELHAVAPTPCAPCATTCCYSGCGDCGGCGGCGSCCGGHHHHGRR